MKKDLKRSPNETKEFFLECRSYSPMVAKSFKKLQTKTHYQKIKSTIKKNILNQFT